MIPGIIYGDKTCFRFHTTLIIYVAIYSDSIYRIVKHYISTVYTRIIETNDNLIWLGTIVCLYPGLCRQIDQGI